VTCALSIGTESGDLEWSWSDSLTSFHCSSCATLRGHLSNSWALVTWSINRKKDRWTPGKAQFMAVVNTDSIDRGLWRTGEQEMLRLYSSAYSFCTDCESTDWLGVHQHKGSVSQVPGGHCACLCCTWGDVGSQIIDSNNHKSQRSTSPTPHCTTAETSTATASTASCRATCCLYS